MARVVLWVQLYGDRPDLREACGWCAGGAAGVLASVGWVSGAAAVPCVLSQGVVDRGGGSGGLVCHCGCCCVAPLDLHPLADRHDLCDLLTHTHTHTYT